MKTVPNSPEGGRQTDSGNLCYPCGDFRVFRITPTDPESLKYLPRLHVRALDFVEKYGAETDPVFLTNLIYGHFRNSQTHNLLHVLVAIDCHDQIVAHSVSYVEEYPKLGHVVNQLQSERDHGVEPVSAKAIHDMALKLIEEWAKTLGIKTIIASALSLALARLHKRDGFEPYRVLVRKSLEA